MDLTHPPRYLTLRLWNPLNDTMDSLMFTFVHFSVHSPSFYFQIRYLIRPLQLSVMYHKTMLRNSLKGDGPVPFLLVAVISSDKYVD